MPSADRLHAIIQALRRAKRPLTAAQIAEAVEISRRTVYRDVAALVAQGVPIRGEAGTGFVLERSYHLPPLMFTESEIEAIALGAQWVAANADESLATAARDVMAKVAVVVPERLRGLVDAPVVGTPPGRAGADLRKLREWARKEQKLRLHYADAAGATTERTVWPVFVGYMEGIRALIAWCELRRDFRIFRTDRLVRVDYLDATYPEPRRTLRRRWDAIYAEKP